jgi:hypothetical protein
MAEMSYEDLVRAYEGPLGRLQGRQQAEDTRRWDADFGLRSQQLGIEKSKVDMQYKIAKLQASTQREAIAVDRWKAEQDARLREAELQLSRELGMGEQGLSVLQARTQLGQQPRSWTALADYNRGVAENPFAVNALAQLATNTGATAGGLSPQMTAPQGLPQQNSLEAVLGDLGVGQAASDATNAAQQAATSTHQASGGAAAPSAAQEAKDDPRLAGINAIIKNWIPSSAEGYDAKDANTLGAVAKLAAMGSHKSANRAAQLTGLEREIIYGGLQKLGMDPNSWQESWEANRVGQQGSGLAA